MKLLIALAVFAAFQLPEKCLATPSPILIVPGILASRLEANDLGPKCNTDNEFEPVWFEPIHALLRTKCTLRALSLLYDTDTDSFHNNEDVELRAPDFGGTFAIEYLNSAEIDKFKYDAFYTTVQYFVDRGYERGKTIRAAPYDWRLAADELEKRGYYHQLKSLIEEMYDSSGGTKVTLMVHSMGGIVTLHFLTGFSEVDQAWKDKYIHAFIPISGAWAGSGPALETVVAGTNGIPSFLPHDVDNLINRFLISITREYESLSWLLPDPTVFGDDVLVSTPSKNYTASDYKELFSTVDYTNGDKFFKRIQLINPNHPAPNVPTYCYYGDKVDTVMRLTYDTDFVPGKSVVNLDYDITYSDGDGSVNSVSSRVCLKWSSMAPKYPFKAKTYAGVRHADMLKEIGVLNEIAAIVGAPEPKQDDSKVCKRDDGLCSKVEEITTGNIGGTSTYLFLFFVSLFSILYCVCVDRGSQN